VSEIAKLAAGMPPQRSIPAFAPQTFQQWWRKRRAPRGGGGRRVVLWPDTFNNHFHPDIAEAAVEVLESAGFEISVPAQSVCCGRPLYDYGMLDRAKTYLRQVIQVLRTDVLWGVPVVVLEPSCAAVFRDELKNILADDQEAQRLSSQTFLLSEFFEKYAPDFAPPKFATTRKAVVHGHCHQKAIMGLDSEVAVLKKIGVDAQALDSGCCGMAGSFGFEKEKYDVSVKCGEQALLPAVRDASPETLIVASGFSCQEQIEQLTNRHAFHLAQVMQMAMNREYAERKQRYPEEKFVATRNHAVKRSMAEAGASLGAALAAATGLLMAAKRRSAA
jgi:Fe-S oxidoreductase